MTSGLPYWSARRHSNQRVPRSNCRLCKQQVGTKRDLSIEWRLQHLWLACALSMPLLLELQLRSRLG